jgi:hypothetical protein
MGFRYFHPAFYSFVGRTAGWAWNEQMLWPLVEAKKCNSVQSETDPSPCEPQEPITVVANYKSQRTVMKVLLVAAAFFSTALASNYVVHHRLFHPSLPTQPYLERGSILIDTPTPMFVPAANLAEDLGSFAEVLESLETPFDALYQVALQQPDDKSEVVWDFSSVKAVGVFSLLFLIRHTLINSVHLQCYLNKVIADTILLHVNGDQDPKPFALDYFVSPIAHDGSCPLSKSNKRISPASAMRAFAKNIQSMNTTILLRATETPPLFVSSHCIVSPCSNPRYAGLNSKHLHLLHLKVRL